MQFKVFKEYNNACRLLIKILMSMACHEFFGKIVKRNDYSFCFVSMRMKGNHSSFCFKKDAKAMYDH